MAEAPYAPHVKLDEHVTDPEAPEAVQIPRGENDGSEVAELLSGKTPNEVFGDEPTEVHSEPAVPAPHDRPPAARGAEEPAGHDPAPQASAKADESEDE